jgi:uncharacterized membrane protein
MARKQNRETVDDATDGLDRVRVIFLVLTAVFALAGLADATYLTAAHLSGATSVCGESQGCSVVLGSPYSSIRGIPTAALGMLGYFGAFTAATLAAFGYARARTWLALIGTVMFVGTLWFLYLQQFVLHAFCPFCLFSAAVTFCLAGLVVANPRSK